MFVKLPICEQTRPKRSGRFQAAVKAQMPPELAPPMARLAGVGPGACNFATQCGIASFSRNGT